MASSEASRLLRVARRDLKMARRLLDPDVEEASWGWAALQCLDKTMPLRAFTTFAVQFRYDDEPEELGLNRFELCNRTDDLIELVQSQIS